MLTKQDLSYAAHSSREEILKRASQLIIGLLKRSSHGQGRGVLSEIEILKGSALQKNFVDMDFNLLGLR